MGDVVFLNVETTLPIPVDRVLDGCRDLKEVVVMGWDKDGRFILAASEADLEGIAYMAQKLLHKIHAGDYERRD